MHILTENREEGKREGGEGYSLWLGDDCGMEGQRAGFTAGDLMDVTFHTRCLLFSSDLSARDKPNNDQCGGK